MQLNFKIFGNPLHETVVILHGMFGTLDNWQTVARLLGERYCVYIVDMRNHGRSPHSDTFGYAVMTADIIEFIEEQALRDVHLVGHSMGGKVAMQVALLAPQLLETLTVVDIAPKTYAGHHQDVFEAMFAINPPDLASRHQAEEILNRFPLDWATKQFILKNLIISKDTQRYEWRMNLSAIYDNYADILGFEPSQNVFTKPTLFIRGEKSNYINPEEFELLTLNFKNARLLTIADAGHWVHADAPQAFVDALFEFI
jgi:esterase